MVYTWMQASGKQQQPNLCVVISMERYSNHLATRCCRVSTCWTPCRGGCARPQLGTRSFLADGAASRYPRSPAIPPRHRRQLEDARVHEICAGLPVVAGMPIFWPSLNGRSGTSPAAPLLPHALGNPSTARDWGHVFSRGRHPRRPVAAEVLLSWSGTTISKYSASDERAWSLRANSLITWHRHQDS